MNMQMIPETLRALDQWCLWKNVVREAKLTKLPFQATGEMASSTNAGTWTTFAKAVDAYGVGHKSYSGIGFVFAADGGLCGIDLDGCRDPKTGAVVEWARKWIIEFDSYAEVSPSKTGVKIFVRGAKPVWCGAKAEVSEPPIAKKNPAVEIYDRGRYFAVTGERLANLPVEPQERQTVIDRFAETFWKRADVAPTTENRDFGSDAAIADRARRYISRIQAISGQGGHGSTFNAACCLVKGFGLPKDVATALLLEWNTSNATPPWNAKEIAHKIDSACKANGETNYLRLARPQDFDRIKLPRYEEPAKPKSETIVTTLAEAANAYLEKVSSQGESLLQLGFPELDNALEGGVEPGEMIVVGARPSHGKSLVALQAIHTFAVRGMPAVMISQEMSALLLGKRTIQFASEIPKSHWKSNSRQVVTDLANHFEHRAESYIVERCVSVDQAAEEITKHVRKYGCKLAVVDYATMLNAAGKDEYERATNISKTMQRCAKETNVALLLLAQMSRRIEDRKKFLPMMSDLRGSGQFEQDADVIFFTVWPWKIDNNQDRSLFNFFIAKNRNREIVSSVCNCVIDPARQMILSKERNEPYDFS